MNACSTGPQHHKLRHSALMWSVLPSWPKSVCIPTVPNLHPRGIPSLLGRPAGLHHQLLLLERGADPRVLSACESQEVFAVEAAINGFRQGRQPFLRVLTHTSLYEHGLRPLGA